MLQRLLVVAALALGALNLERIVTIALFDFKRERDGVIIVTGASSGIGKDAAFALATHGFDVLFGVRKEQDGANVLASFQGSTEAKARLHAVLLDVTDAKQCEAAVARAVQLAASLKKDFVGLVNNAGGSGPIMPAEWTTEQQLRDLMDLNLFGAVRMTHLVLPHLRKRGHGRIVAVSSVISLIATPIASQYAASKCAMDGYFDALRRELVHLGISVSTLNPGCVKSAMTLGKNAVLAKSLRIKNATDPSYADLVWAAMAFENTCGPHGYEPSTSTSLDIVDAITSRHPLPRYTPGNFGGIVSAAWLKRLTWASPDRVVDYIASSGATNTLLHFVYGAKVGELHD